MPKPMIKMELTLVAHIDPLQLPKQVLVVLGEIEREKGESDYSWQIRQRDHLVAYLNKSAAERPLEFFVEGLVDAADKATRAIVFRGRD